MSRGKGIEVNFYESDFGTVRVDRKVADLVMAHRFDRRYKRREKHRKGKCEGCEIEQEFNTTLKFIWRLGGRVVEVTKARGIVVE